MALRIELHSGEYAAAVRRLNDRFREHNVREGFLIPERCDETNTVPPSAPVVKRHYLLLDGDVVRGGFILQEQAFWAGGQIRPVANCQMPITEGLVDQRYAFAGPAMMKKVLEEHPLLFAVGMGGPAQPFPRLLAAMRWRVEPVPFLFRVRNCRRFLREIRTLRGSFWRRLAAGIASYSGLGWAGIHALQEGNRLRHGWELDLPRLEMEPVAEWGPWADEIWEATRERCSMIGVRDHTTLAYLYPLANERWTAYRLRQNARTVGWTVLLVTRMADNPYFGDMLVGTLLDALALPGYEGAVAHSSRRALEEQGADLILTNQAHRRWIEAFRGDGFLTGPSNFLLATSVPLTALLQPPDSIHLTRGDGDGRIAF